MGKKVKGILLLLVQSLLPIFIKTPAAIIVSQGGHKKTERWGELQGHLEPFHSIFLALLSQVAVKQIYSLFTWKIFVSKFLRHGKFLSFAPLKQKTLCENYFRRKLVNYLWQGLREDLEYYFLDFVRKGGEGGTPKIRNLFFGPKSSFLSKKHNF